ncbi:GCN5 N-acetyltransferase [Clohesyomyces aquaticus]|uniref:GCN5 N-acetyltransferase n=1 Tax=Clohesyomyces aquaticus TaxID=1231657 RepID=A0A1Y1Z483_9PLEO|nr:GCN5 N-acetyltransferase [Clohesyomyces aquaticus]
MDNSPDKTAPNRNSNVTFREVTADNYIDVASLSLKDGQIGNLDPNVWSLLVSRFEPEAWVRAVYADETPVGMLMLEIWDPTESYHIWRFMIDRRYQHLGYGRQGVEFAVAHIRQNHPRAKQLKLSSTPREGKKNEKNPKQTVKPEDSPYMFYEKLGFREIGPPDENGDVLMGVDL